MNEDLNLLREYARNNSEEAFTTLVSRHVNLVYSVALRQTQDAHLAEEITQAVFIILARKADSLGDNIILSGWLCRTARYAGANALKIQRRRQQREQEAYMQSQFESSEKPTGKMWNEISPFFDDALEKLGPKDHDALVLRFFENKSFAEVGAALGASEDAAKMRVNRALEKLRGIFSKCGVSSTTTILAGTISTHSVQAAPVGLAKTISTVALVKGATASTSTLTLIKGALKIMAWTKMKTAAIVGAAVILTVGTTGLVIHHEHRQRAGEPLPQNAWAFVGFATPDATLQSSFWAMNNGDLSKLLESFTPEFKGRYTESVANVTESQQVAIFKNAANTFGDFQVDRRETLPDGELLLHIYSTKVGNAHVPMKQIGGEWKINGNLTSDNLTK